MPAVATLRSNIFAEGTIAPIKRQQAAIAPFAAAWHIGMHSHRSRLRAEHDTRGRLLWAQPQRVPLITRRSTSL